MPTKNEIKRLPDNAPVGPDFRPLSKEEQNEYMNSMSHESKKILAELMSKKSLSLQSRAIGGGTPQLRLLDNDDQRRVTTARK